jgi:uncharacterized caspase-like protein
MLKPRFIKICEIIFLALLFNHSFAENRLALVIGNSNYKHEPSLNSPVNDAEDMATELKKLGFEVILVRDAGKRLMEDKVNTFSRKLFNYQAGLFYYSGHGLQDRGENYLVPIDAKISSAADIKYKSVNVNWLLRKMEEADNNVNLIFLDACRDNPIKTGKKGFSKGLAKVDSPMGSLIAFATAPDTAALDGFPNERNSIYTKHLLNSLRTQASLYSIADLLTNVTRNVKQETNKEQIPWITSSLDNIFYFTKSQQAIPVEPTKKLTDLQIIKQLENKLNIKLEHLDELNIIQLVID